jgi:hypothetical protein
MSIERQRVEGKKMGRKSPHNTCYQMRRPRVPSMRALEPAREKYHTRPARRRPDFRRWAWSSLSWQRFNQQQPVHGITVAVRSSGGHHHRRAPQTPEHHTRQSPGNHTSRPWAPPPPTWFEPEILQVFSTVYTHKQQWNQTKWAHQFHVHPLPMHTLIPIHTCIFSLYLLHTQQEWKETFFSKTNLGGEGPHGQQLVGEVECSSMSPRLQPESGDHHQCIRPLFSGCWRKIQFLRLGRRWLGDGGWSTAHTCSGQHHGAGDAAGRLHQYGHDVQPRGPSRWRGTTEGRSGRHHFLK